MMNADADAHGMPIFFSSRLRKTIAWLALCAMCFGAAAPTVSKWLAATAQAADRGALCDGHGMDWVPASQLPASAAQNQQQDHHHGGHSGGGQPDDEGDCCPYCTLIHHWPWVPAAAVAFAPHAPLLATQGVTADVSSPALRVGRRPHQPRAPPFV